MSTPEDQPDGIDRPDRLPDERLGDLIEHSFGPGPEPRPAHEQLAIGRRARRRRRLMAGAGAALAVLTVVGVGGTVAAMTGGGGARTAELPASAGSAGATTTRATPTLSAAERRARQRATRAAEHRTEQRLVSELFPAALSPEGDLIVQDGWRVTRRVEEPMRYQPPKKSLGVVVTDGEQTLWMLLTLDSQQSDPAGKGYSRFEDWLASMIELNGGTAVAPLVTIGADDTISAGPGATVVEVRSAPVIPDYTTAGDRMVQVRRDGRTWFVVVRGHGARAERIPVDADVLPASTFDALVDYLTAQTDSGEGVR